MTIKTVFASVVFSSFAMLSFAQSAPPVDGGNTYAPSAVVAPERGSAKPPQPKVKHQAKHRVTHKKSKHHKAGGAKKHKKHGVQTSQAKGPGLQAF